MNPQALPNESLVANPFHEDWHLILRTLAPKAEDKHIHKAMELLAGAVEKYLVSDEPTLLADDLDELYRAQVRSELRQAQKSVLHVFAQCEEE